LTSVEHGELIITRNITEKENLEIEKGHIKEG